MSVLKFKPKDCYIYLDKAAEENGGAGNKYWWPREYSDKELAHAGLECVGFRRDNVDIFFDTDKVKRFEKSRIDVNSLFDIEWGLI